MLQAGALDGELVAELGELLRPRAERHRVVLGCRKSRELTMDARSDIRRIGDTPADELSETIEGEPLRPWSPELLPRRPMEKRRDVIVDCRPRRAKRCDATTIPTETT